MHVSASGRRLLPNLLVHLTQEMLGYDLLEIGVVQEEDLGRFFQDTSNPLRNP